MYNYNIRSSSEFAIARALLDLEWQVTRGGSVNPRVLEPLIAMTLSDNSQDHSIAASNVKQMVSLL